MEGLVVLHGLVSDIPLRIMKEVKHLDFGVEGEDANPDINELLKSTVLSGGKRLRPMLSFLMGELFDVSAEIIRPYARAIELVHAASLSHDDVIDNATIRRGRPSINVVASNKKAVLAGDYLLADVIVSLVSHGNYDLVKEMSLIIQALSEGEWLQLDMSERRDTTKDEIRDIAKKKTSSVMSWCTTMPAILANASSETIVTCRTFGEYLGMAFQLIDDTFDFQEHSSKDTLIDLQNGIVNSVAFELFKLRPDLYQTFKQGDELQFDDAKKDIERAVRVIKSEAAGLIEHSHSLLNNIVRMHETSNRSALGPLQSVLKFLALRGK